MIFRKKRGFTLIEVILVIALSAMIMLAASSLLLTFTQVWLSTEDAEDVSSHVEALSRFLENRFAESTFPLNKSNETTKMGWKWPPGANELRENPQLSFEMVMPHALLGGVDSGTYQCYLSLEKGTGMHLQYQRIVKEKAVDKQLGRVEDKPLLYTVRLSEVVEEIQYLKYDEGSGRFEPVDYGKKDKSPLPDLITLVYMDEDERKEVHLYVGA